MSKPYILGIDPSGSFKESKGTTGFALLSPDCIVVEHETVEAKHYSSQINYWVAVLKYIEMVINYVKSMNNQLVLSVEDYVLYAASAKAQINSEMETSKLIGAITLIAYQKDIPMYIRSASQVMNRWSNKILEHKELIESKGNRYIDDNGDYFNPHSLDALRHAVHCYHFEVDKK